jgi:hypothetical protein
MAAVVPIVAGVAHDRSSTEKFSSESDDTSKICGADSWFDSVGCCSGVLTVLSHSWFVVGACSNGLSFSDSSLSFILRFLVNAGEVIWPLSLGCKIRQHLRCVCCAYAFLVVVLARNGPIVFDLMTSLLGESLALVNECCATIGECYVI